jgi:hypothetical protein
MFGSLGGFLTAVRATLFGTYKDPDAMIGPTGGSSGSAPLVQIAVTPKA